MRDADELSEVALAESTEHGCEYWTAAMRLVQGWSLCQQGRAAEGVARMHAGFADAVATGARIVLPMFCALLAQTYGQVGWLDQAWRMLSDALSAVEESGQRHYEAETYRFKASCTC